MWIRVSIAAVALAAAHATAGPLQPAQKHPLAQKYSDRGAKPSHGRVGTAELGGRALIGRDGRTRIDLTTGSFEGGAATGTLEKVQVKLFAGDKLVATDNHKDLGAAATLDYTRLVRGNRVEVQANVKAGARGRTEVVALDTTVVRRPDVAAIEVIGPDNVSLGATLPVTAYVEEMNGDVGARFDCRLFIDDVPAGEVAGAWVDAGSRVACRFLASFPTAGDKRVTVRVAGVSPADDDAANNAAETLVNVRAQPFSWSEARYYWSTSAGSKHYWERHWTNSDYFREEIYEAPWASSSQSYGAIAGVEGEYPIAGTLRLNHSMDGNPIAPVEVDLGALVDFGNGCKWGVFEGGIYSFACSRPGETYAGAFVESGAPVFSPGYWWGMAAAIPHGNQYRVEIELLSPAISRRSTVDVTIPPLSIQSTNGWLPWNCTFEGGDFYNSAVSAYCWRQWYYYEFAQASVWQAR